MRGDREAFGGPGIEPRWAHGDKDGVGTAYSASSRLWFTLWKAIVTEVYYPTVDRPQLRDLQFLVSDGETFVHDELKALECHCGLERLDPSLGYIAHGKDPEGRYAIRKEIITDPHLPCLLLRVRVEGDIEFIKKLKLYVLCAPHLNVGGWGNNASVVEAAGRDVLVAEQDGVALALAATQPFSRLSVGYAGVSDGWIDLQQHKRLEWEFDRAPDGNVALAGELDLSVAQELVVGVGFGDNLHAALTAMMQGLGVPFDRQLERYREQWSRTANGREPLEAQSSDGGNLYRSSHALLLAHEDKTYQGALIASLAIPWGEAKGDEEGKGGYHLVWTRDMAHSASGLLAAGKTETPYRALIYLAASQLPDGSFPQNFWINGDPYWTGKQLDEAALPMLLAHRIWRMDALGDLNVRALVLRAAGYLIRQGPVTEQERWEEASGYSPSTLAACIAALVAAAEIGRSKGKEENASFAEAYADFLEANLERWTVTNNGTLHPDIRRHYVRVHPATEGDPLPENLPDDRMFTLTSRPPGERYEWPAREIVDAGFLELVRYGIRRADDPLIQDTVAVIDKVLKVDTPFGPVWRRYNYDGYGQRSDGGPYEGHGQGRAWPMLTGERGHYELACGRDPRPYIEAMEKFASQTGLLPEQVWDEADRPDQHLYLGKPTGSASPLLWAHAEYIKLLRSARDGEPFDFVPVVRDRYQGDRRKLNTVTWWSRRHPAPRVPRGHTLRLHADMPFRVRWSSDDWGNQQDMDSVPTELGVHYSDLPVSPDGQVPLRFTFYWPHTDRWESRDFETAIEETTG